MRGLILPIGDRNYVVPFKTVRQVLGEPRLTPLPLAPAPVIGLVNFGGEISPVFDSALLLGLAPFDAPCVVLLDTSVGVAGITVSDIPVPADLAAAKPGFYAWQEESIPLLDVEQVLVSLWSK
jgi:chemotaxis signal transduction protein